MAKSWDSLDTCQNLVNLIKERTIKVEKENINDINKLLNIADIEQDPFKSNKILDLINCTEIPEAEDSRDDINNIREKNNLFINLHKKYGNYMDYIDFYGINFKANFDISGGYCLDISLNHYEINNRIFDIDFYYKKVLIQEYSSIENYKNEDDMIEHEINYDGYDTLKGEIYKIMDKCDKVDRLIHFITECNEIISKLILW